MRQVLLVTKGKPGDRRVQYYLVDYARKYETGVKIIGRLSKRVAENLMLVFGSGS